MKNSMPEGYVERFLKKEKHTIFFGVPINALSRDELIAVAIDGWERYTEEINQRFKSYGGKDAKI